MRIVTRGMVMEIKHTKISIDANDMRETEPSHRVVNAKDDDRDLIYGRDLFNGGRVIGSTVRIRQPKTHKEFEVMP